VWSKQVTITRSLWPLHASDCLAFFINFEDGETSSEIFENVSSAHAFCFVIYSDGCTY
jgi:hypothetical protein